MTCASRAVAAALLVLGAATACGKRGNPLPPLRPPPGAVTDATARRADDQIELRFTIPAKNADNTTPSVVQRIEVFAVVAAKPPKTADLQAPKNLKGKVDVKPPVSTDTDESDPAAPKPADTRPAPGEGAIYAAPVARETGGATPGPDDALHYALVSVTGNRRTSAAVVSVPLAAAPGTPREPALSYDEKTLVLKWQPAAEGDTFRVYAVDEHGKETTGRPIGDKPVTAAHVDFPIEWDKPRCFTVRAVKLTGAAGVESPAAGPVCATPADTFPPASPVLRPPVPTEGAVNLIWDGVDAPDLAGYLVLRAANGDDTLQPLTPAPIAATTFRDETTRAGVRYSYAVVAVDKAGNRSALSARVDVVGR